MLHIILPALLSVALLVSSALSAAMLPDRCNLDALPDKKFRNVIILVADGCGVAHLTVTRWAIHPVPMAIDRCRVALVRTYCANSLITDSAPAATAFACGIKAYDKTVGMMPKEVTVPGIDTAGCGANRLRPVANILEGARLCGRATGLVSTSQIQHATPAGFSAHTHQRDRYTDIALQQVYQNIDVVLGGGERYLADTSLRLVSDTAARGFRLDGLDLRSVLAKRGYRTVYSRSELLALTRGASSSRIWGAFAPEAMAYERDRRLFAAAVQPSLSEMTAKAIELLSGKSKEGFFLFVEASKIDWASHLNDASGVVSDYAEFDKALGRAVDFADKDGKTLVLAFSDHDNGGMTLGMRDLGYSSYPYADFIKPFRADSLLTAEGVVRIFHTRPQLRDSAGIRHVMATYYGVPDLTEGEFTALWKPVTEANGSLGAVIAPMFSKRAGIGWSTGGHDGSDVPLFVYGLNQVPGWLDNTDIARFCARAMGFSLAVSTAALYAPADSLFPDAKMTVDSVSVNNGKETLYPACHLEIGKDRITVAVGSDSAYVNDTARALGGISVYSVPRRQLYLPRTCRDLLNRLKR